MKKLNLASKLKFAVGLGVLSLSVSSFAGEASNIPTALSSSEEHGCKAYLCFAGGMGESACQSTIKKVTRDLAKGKSFPKCSFISGGNGNNGVISAGAGTPQITTTVRNKRIRILVDGKQVASVKKN